MAYSIAARRTDAAGTGCRDFKYLKISLNQNGNFNTDVKVVLYLTKPSADPSRQTHVVVTSPVEKYRELFEFC